MTSPETIDFAVLLAGFDGDNPAGINLRDDEDADSLFRRIKEERENSSRIERKHLEDPANVNLNECTWHKVLQLCQEALSSHTKDFEVVAWYCEALVRSDGFAGLRDSFRLAREYAEQFWEHLYPMPDDGDYTPRTRLLGGLFRATLLLPIKRIPLARDDVTFLDWDAAERLESITDSTERSRRIDAGAMTCAEIEQSVRDSPDDFYRTLTSDLKQCIEEFDKLDDVLTQVCGTDESGYDQAPATSDTSNLLSECDSVLKKLLGDRLLEPEPEPEESAGDEEGRELAPPGASNSNVKPGASQEMTREVAFRMLSELAVFFRRTEPHSPVSHHIEQAVRWGKLPLPDLLKELITDESSLQEVFTRVGIDLPAEE